jgi:L-iditol 2-dehydrogenase
MCEQFKASHIDPCGLADRIRLPGPNVEHATFRLPDHVSDVDGTFVEPLACGVRALRRSSVREGDQVAIFGTGVMGILIGQAARALGAQPVGVEIHPGRARLAEMLGIAAGRPKEVDFAVLTAVTPETIRAALAAVRPGGHLHLFAQPTGEPALSLDGADLYHREISILTTYSSSPEDLKESLDLISSGKVRVGPLVSHRMKLDEVERGIELQRRGQAIKVVFEP